MRFENSFLVIYLMLSALLMSACMPHFIQEKRAEALYHDGQHLHDQGQYPQALEKFEASLDLAIKIGYKAGVAHNNNEMAIIYTAQSEFDKARNYLNKAVVMYKELNMNSEVSKALNNIAITHVSEGAYFKALQQYQELLEWDGQTGNDLGRGITFFNMGRILESNLGKPGEARNNYIQALKIFQSIGNQKYLKAVQKYLKER